MSILTLARFLMGSRAAIQAIAGNRHALWIGLLFVLSAGFAREYDGEDLLHEPWYVLIPVAASLGTSFLLFTSAYGIAAVKGDAPTGRRFFSAYLSFLGLFWMTAPLAWLYAIPYEQFLSPGDAMRANLSTLGLVSLWRVALMLRVLVVLLGYSAREAFSIVMLFATVVAMTLIYLTPLPVIDFMGGIRTSERDRVLRTVAHNVCCLGVVSLPVWAVCVMNVLATSKPTWQLRGEERKGAGTLPWLAFAALAVWPFILPHTQPPQQRRRAVEKIYARGKLAEAVAELSRHTRSDYPPGWDPPPRQFSLVVEEEEVLRLLEELTKDETAEWVRSYYLDLVQDALGHLLHVSDDHLQRLGKTLTRIPGGDGAIEAGLAIWEDRYNAEGARRMRQLLQGGAQEKKADGKR